jgi:hypothetical protein
MAFYIQMQILKTLLFVTLLISSFTVVEYVKNFAIAIPPDLLNHKHVFGPLIGVTKNDTGDVDWVIAGTWRSILTNDTNDNTTQNNQSSGAFKAAIEMIRPDGTSRHSHTLTDFVVMNSTQNADNNSTIFNGTSTISLHEGPAVDIPTSIQRSNNGNIYIVTIDPESVDYHFGKSPLIYGIVSNPQFMKASYLTR